MDYEERGLHPSLMRIYAQEKLREAEVCLQAGGASSALLLTELVIRDFQRHPDPTLRETTAEALFIRCRIFGRFGFYEDANKECRRARSVISLNEKSRFIIKGLLDGEASLDQNRRKISNAGHKTEQKFVEDRINQHKAKLFSMEIGYIGDVNGKTTTPPRKRGSSEARQRLPLPETGHELTRPETPTQARQLAESLAQHSNTSISDAEIVVNAMWIDPAAMIEAGKKIVNRKPKLSIKDFSEAELNNPKVIHDAHKTVNENRRTRIEDLDEEKANELRRARLLVQYDRGRRDRQSIPS